MAASFLEGPALQAPPGLESNLVNPYSLEQVDIAVIAIAIVVPTIVLGLRVYSKVFVLKKLGADDYVLMTGWAFYMAYSAWALKLVHEGVDRHMWDVRLIDLISMLHVSTVTRLTRCYDLLRPPRSYTSSSYCTISLLQ
jgi:hypothetical protein